ncbi:MAG: FG-GAP-like repeat-containing protein, partial [Kiritimatiellae bacterium]|nr:FG-GAP-like repeat-containing protein [Kiritimatiellia bacterium]
VKTELGPAPTSCGGGKLEARLPPLGRALWRLGVSAPPKPAEVLVSREGNCVERWRAAGGRWTRAGIFLDGSSGVKPAGIAAAGDTVYVADLSGKDSGRIVKFAPDGRRIGVLAETPCRPDQLCVSPDGGFLYVTALHANTVLRYALADGKGGAYICEKLAGPRMLAFGPDGYLHVACRASNSIAVWDVAGASPRFVGKIGTSDGQGGLAFAGADGAVLVVPGRVSERIDLAASRTAPLGEKCTFVNAFAALRLGEAVCAGDYISGIVALLPEKEGTPVEVASGLGGVCALLDLTGALDGSTSRRQAEESRAFQHKDKGFVYDTPLLPGVRDLERMAFNNPDAIVDLGCGIWPNPFIYDYDGDDDLDIVISYRSVPSEGTYFFENPAPQGTTGSLSVFEAAVPGDNSRRGLRVKFPPYHLPVSLTPHFRRGNGGGWYYAELTGDGREDAVYAISDWAEYGCPGPACPVAYDPDGNWTNNQLLAYMYLCRNLGGEGPKTLWGSPEPLFSGGKRELQGPWGSPLPLFHDWDGDGDLDFVTSDFISEFWYFENTGTKDNPVFAAGRRVKGTDKLPLEGALCMMSARKVDWDGDGRPDIIASEEDGRVALYRNTGGFADGAPVFETARFFRQKAAEIKFGCLATPWGVDWDGDGDWDLVCGNSEGRIAFIENLSGPGVENPKWAAPKLLTVSDTAGAAPLWLKGNEIRALCGPSNSPQGPAEQKWGYTVLSVADWDGDGYLDIMANDVKGSVVLFRNPGKKGTTVLESPKSVEVEWKGEQPRFSWEWRKPTGKALRAPWRTTPCMHDWNRDGLMDLVMLDHEGFLCLYARAKRGGRLVLLPPERIFCDEKGNPLALAARPGGGAGRRKFCIADWDGDGKPDLVMNGVNAYVFRQVGAKDGKFLFKEGRALARKALAGHTCCPAAVDFNADGTTDLVIGAEDGNFYYLRHP